MCYLLHRTGAEMFTRDLAMWLRRRGHAVTIFATAFGDMADELRLASIACITDVADMAARPDVIIGNTHHETVRALVHFHDVPVLTICHDRSADHGRPAQFAQVKCHVAVDENCAERLVNEFGITRERIQLIQNGIDLSRFLPRPALPARPQSALVFSNQAVHDAQLDEIRAACVARGMRLDVVGMGSGNHLTDPAQALGRYDLVFGKARCATEALVTGNAVVMLDPAYGMGEMVNPANVAHARRWNFGRALLTRPIHRDNVGAELDRYDAADAQAAAAWMRERGGLDVSLGELERCAMRLAEQHAVVAVPAEQRARELAHYVDDWIRRGSTTSVHLHLASARQHAESLQQALNEMQHAHQQAFAHERARHDEQLRAELEGVPAELEAARAELEAVRADAEHRARAARAEVAALQTQVRELHASRSWRVTAPLRRLSKGLLSKGRRA